MKRAGRIGGRKVMIRIREFPLDLSQYDGKRLAIVIAYQGETSHIIRGTARFENDDMLGHLLRVRVTAEEGEILEDQGDPNFVFYEQVGNFKIRPDQEFGCDYCVRLDNSGSSARPVGPEGNPTLN